MSFERFLSNFLFLTFHFVLFMFPALILSSPSLRRTLVQQQFYSTTSLSSSSHPVPGNNDYYNCANSSDHYSHNVLNFCSSSSSFRLILKLRLLSFLRFAVLLITDKEKINDAAANNIINTTIYNGYFFIQILTIIFFSLR